MSFNKRVADAAQFLLSLPQPVMLVGHLDTDGLCATAIMGRALERLEISYTTQIVPQISTVFLKKLSGAASYIFLDGGSTHAQSLNELFSEPVLVIDHHAPESALANHHFLLNPLLDKLDGAREVCTATVAYLLAKELDIVHDDLAHLAVIGAIGDAHEKNGLLGPNKVAFEEAIAVGTVATMMAPCFFGVFSKPLAKLLASSHDLKIPGITKEYHASRTLLRELDIPERDGAVKRTYADLSLVEREKLIVCLGELKPGADALVEHYELPMMDGVLRDARQFATLLNACGRLDKANLGLAIAKGDADAELARDVLAEYRTALNKAMEWFETHDAPDVVREDGLIVISAGRAVPPSIAGTLCSIITRGGMVSRGTVVLALARYSGGLTKVSARVAGYDEPVDLNALVGVATSSVDGESGGHRSAAGAIIDSASEEEFVKAFREALREK